MNNITIIDVFKKAIEMEEAGKIFYEYVVSISKDENIKKVMSVLANEETTHRHIFENMMNKISNQISSSVKIKEEKYIKHIDEHLSTKLVFDRKKFDEKKDNIKNIISAIEFAIERELDSILYYMTFMAIVKEEHASLVQTIIEEEKQHFIKLSEAKKIIKK